MRVLSIYCSTLTHSLKLTRISRFLVRRVKNARCSIQPDRFREFEDDGSRGSREGSGRWEAEELSDGTTRSSGDALAAHRENSRKHIEASLFNHQGRTPSLSSSNNKGRRELAFVVGIDLPTTSAPDTAFTTKESLEELGELARLNGFHVQGCDSQRLDKQTDYFLNGGKMKEIFAEMISRGCTTLLIDAELTPNQQRSIEDLYSSFVTSPRASPIKILDRTALLLGALAKNACTYETFLQVECAQLIHFIPRMSAYLSKLIAQGRRSGLGLTCLKGSCDRVIETDVGAMRRRLSKVRSELRDLVSQRESQRELRRKTGLPSVAIVGYAGSGKSFLFSSLSDLPSDDLSQDASKENTDQAHGIFSTLRPTTRRIIPGTLPPSGTVKKGVTEEAVVVAPRRASEFFLTDTMGIISALPAVVREAFRSSFADEVISADVILHVVDVSHPLWRKREAVMLRELTTLGCSDKILLSVFNQKSAPEGFSSSFIPRRRHSGFVPHHKKGGEAQFSDEWKLQCISLLQKGFSALMVDISMSFPYFRTATWSRLNEIFRLGTLLEVTYSETLVHVRGKVPTTLKMQLLAKQEASNKENCLLQEVTDSSTPCGKTIGNNFKNYERIKSPHTKKETDNCLKLRLAEL